MSEEHTHRWRVVHEQSLIGGSYPVGWDCLVCGKYVDNAHLTPEGLGGEVTKAARLLGPHGGVGNTADWRIFKEQILSEDGQLTVVYQ